MAPGPYSPITELKKACWNCEYPQQLNVAMKILNSVASCIQTSHLCPCLPIKHICFKRFVFAFCVCRSFRSRGCFCVIHKCRFLFLLFLLSPGLVVVVVVVVAVVWAQLLKWWQRQPRGKTLVAVDGGCSSVAAIPSFFHDPRVFSFFSFLPSALYLFFPCPSFFLKSGCCSWILTKKTKKPHKKKNYPFKRVPPHKNFGKCADMQTDLCQGILTDKCID